MPTPQEAHQWMNTLSRDDILTAARIADTGETGGFAESTRYDLLLDGKRYPPKRIVGIALNARSKLQFTPYEFKGGEHSLCFRTLQKLKFDVVDKEGRHYPRRDGAYDGMLTREWVVDAIKALGGEASRDEIESWIVPRMPGFKTTNIDPDLQLLTVNDRSRSNHSHNTRPRRSDEGDEMDLLFRRDDGRYVFYDPARDGVWELRDLAGDGKLRPVQVRNAQDSAAALKALAAAEAGKDFDADSEEDAREKELRAIAKRKGQPQFRAAVLEAYDFKCAITGCDVQDALEAAHILPFRGEHTNVVRNGLLLRADMHSLFDQGLFRIDPDTLRIVLAPQLLRSSYASLQDHGLRVPAAPALQPDREALRRHGEKFFVART